MHIWHHMHDLPHGHNNGVNFGISLSLWDWLFRTAYWPSPKECPAQQPDHLGYPGMENLPRSLPARFLAPIWQSFKALWKK